MPPLPDHFEQVPVAEVCDVLAQATLSSAGGPEFMASMIGVHQAAALSLAGFAVVRASGAVRGRAWPLRPRAWTDAPGCGPTDVPEHPAD